MKNLTRAMALALACTIAMPSFAGVPMPDVPSRGIIMYVKLPDGTYAPLAGDASANGSVVGSFSASLSGFNETAGAVANLAVTATSAAVALPTGPDYVITNSGSYPIRYRLTVGTSTALVTDKFLAAGAATGVHVTTQTFINAILDPQQAVASALNIQGGTGLAAGYGGGGGSGGGGGGAVTNAGTFAVQATQAGTWTIQPGNTPNTTAWKVDGSAVTQPISVASIPSHAVTNAGTFAVQNSAATPAGSAIIGKVSTVDSGGTDATDTTNHAIKVNVVAGGAGGGAVYGPTAVGSAAANPPVLMAGTANATATGNVQVAKVDSGGLVHVSVDSATGVAQASTTAGQTVSPVGCRTLTSAPTDTTAQTNIPWCTTKGSQVVAQPTAGDFNATVVGTGTLAVQAAPTASAAGGWTKFNLTAANSTNATNIKASAGALGHVAVYNNSATLAWVSFYNTAGTPTCGTSIVYQTMIPANSTSGAGAVEDFAVPLDFSTGIGICVATGIAGTGSVAASSYVVNLGFK